MCEILYTQRGEAGCWYEYYLLIENLGAFSCGKEHFGVKLVSSRGEHAVATHLTTSYEKIINVLSSLVRARVTPTTLFGAINDLAARAVF